MPDRSYHLSTRISLAGVEKFEAAVDTALKPVEWVVILVVPSPNVADWPESVDVDGTALIAISDSDFSYDCRAAGGRREDHIDIINCDDH